MGSAFHAGNFGRKKAQKVLGSRKITLFLVWSVNQEQDWEGSRGEVTVQITMGRPVREVLL